MGRWKEPSCQWSVLMLEGLVQRPNPNKKRSVVDKKKKKKNFTAVTVRL